MIGVKSSIKHLKHVGSTNFYPFGFNLEKSGRDFFFTSKGENELLTGVFLISRAET